jgi:uncharacterized Zn finger protein
MAPISEVTIQHNATDSSFIRGEEYFDRGAVTDIVRRGNQIQSQVEGSEAEAYRVMLQTDSGGITAVYCTCPYDYGGWCKHIVATALTWVREPDRIENRPTLAELLQPLNLAQTQHLVEILVENQPELIEQVDRQVVMLTHSVTPKQQPTPRKTTIDPTPIQRQVKQIMREGIRALEDGYEEDPFSDGLMELIEKAGAFSRKGDGNSAIAILEAITTAYVGEWGDLLDYGGEAYSIADSLDKAWTEAILCTELSQPEVVDWSVLLEEWQDQIDADFSMSIAALHQGWHDPDLQAVLQGDVSFLSGTLDAYYAENLASIRLQILDRQERQQEYLNLARAAGLLIPYLTRLVELGDVDLAMITARDRMSTAEEVFALAKTLREQEHFAEALTIAAAGLPLPGGCRYNLAHWTSELAEGLGNPAIAMDASVLAFKLRPSFADYQRAHHFAATNWPSLKPDLLQTLRQYREWGASEAKVDIFLYEGLIEDAIQSVRSGSVYGTTLVHRVMEAARSQQPDWVIEEARKQAEPIIDRGKADRYQEAVAWLQQAKAAYLASGQADAWRTYYGQLRSTHARKRKLMELFNRL